MDEKELIAGLIKGDESACRKAVEDYQKMVLSVTYKFTGNAASAEDIAQEVFLSVFESIGSFRSDSKLSTWIYRIAISKSLNHLSYEKRKKRFGKIVSLFDKSDSVRKISAPDYENPEKGIEQKERIAVINNALEKLPGNQRIAFTLSKIDELSYEEIAEVMQTTIPAVESLLHRAKQNLQRILSDYYYKVYKI